jgi:hypothetical protein
MKISRSNVAGALVAAACASVGSAMSAGTQAPRQPVGEIVNPSAEMLGPDGQPSQWIVDPRPWRGVGDASVVALARGHAQS